MLGRACERWRCARVLDVALARTWSRVPLRWVTEHAAVTASRGGPAATSSNVLHVFDPDVKRAQRERAAWLKPDSVDPLHSEIAERLLERFQDIARPFPRVLVLGGAMDAVAQHLFTSAKGVQAVTFADSVPAQLASAARFVPADQAHKCTYTQLSNDDRLPASLEPGTFDAVVACLGLHWRNDLPGVLLQCRKALVPDGLLLAALLGGNTLQELRVACALAEQERQGGLSARVSPLAQVRDAGDLLGRAGLALPTVDVDTLTARYVSPADAVTHLRVLGESNACINRRKGPIARDTALAAAAAMIAYSGKIAPAVPGDDDEEAEEATAEQAPPPPTSVTEVCMTFQVVYMAGWSPDSSQPSAKRRGSATASLADLAAQLSPDPAARG